MTDLGIMTRGRTRYTGMPSIGQLRLFDVSAGPMVGCFDPSMADERAMDKRHVRELTRRRSRCERHFTR